MCIHFKTKKYIATKRATKKPVGLSTGYKFYIKKGFAPCYCYIKKNNTFNKEDKKCHIVNIIFQMDLLAYYYLTINLFRHLVKILF